MSVDQLLSHFDLTLSQDVVKDVQTTGVPFTKEIWGEGTGKRDLLGCIILDKSEQDVVRVKFSVYKKDGDTGENKNSQTEHSGAINENAETSESAVQAQQQQDTKNSQTEKETQEENSTQTGVQNPIEQQQQTDKREVGDRFSQTEQRTFGTCHVQTEQAKLEESFMQTDEVDQFEQICQTDQPALVESCIQTEPVPSSEQCLQTEPPPTGTKQVQASWTSKEITTQTVIKQFQETPAQTEVRVCEQNSQTDPTPLSDSGVQASVQVYENVAQTDIKEFADSNVQTEIKVHEQGIQTIKTPVTHSEVLTEPMIIIDPEDQIEMDAQTDPMRVIDPMLDRDAAVQTEYGKVIYPEIMFDNVCQTDDVKIVTLETQTDGASQTDFVFITQPEDLQENVVQTDDVTILNPETQVSTETQTNLVWVVGLQQDEHATKEPEAPVMSPEAPLQVDAGVSELNQEAEMVGEPAMDQMVGSEGITAQPAGSPETRNIHTENEEKWVQTDPVTIIIGDSSFLLQQLANINRAPETVPQQVPPRRKPGRPPIVGGTSIYNRSRQDIPPMLERESQEGVAQQTSQGALDGVNSTEMPILEAESGNIRKGVKMLVPKQQQRNPYRGPYSVSGMRSTNSQQQQQQQIMTTQSQVQGELVQHVQDVNVQNPYQQEIQAELQGEHAQPQELEDSGPKGKFNCPFCTATYDDTPALYKHIHEDHGTPRCSTRKARRKGTIIVDDDGSMHIVGEQNTLWELNDENMKRYRRQRQYSPRTPKYAPKASSNVKQESGLFREDDDIAPSAIGAGEGSGMVSALHQGESEEQVTVQIMQNGGDNQQAMVKQNVSISQQLPESATLGDPVGVASSGLSPAEAAGKREFSCPRCPRLFTKSSELYIHLQNSHKATNRGRGRGRGAYHQLHIVEATDLEHQELIEGQPPAVIQLQEQQLHLQQAEGVEGQEIHAHHQEEAEEQEVEIRVEYGREEDLVQQPQQQEQQQEFLDEESEQQLPMSVPDLVGQEAEGNVVRDDAEEELPAIKVTRRGRPRVKREDDDAVTAQGEQSRSTRTAKRKGEDLDSVEEGEVSGLVMAEEEHQPRRGRSAASSETPPKRGVGRPPGKRGRRH